MMTVSRSALFAITVACMASSAAANDLGFMAATDAPEQADESSQVSPLEDEVVAETLGRSWMDRNTIIIIICAIILAAITTLAYFLGKAAAARAEAEPSASAALAEAEPSASAALAEAEAAAVAEAAEKARREAEAAAVGFTTKLPEAESRAAVILEGKAAVAMYAAITDIEKCMAEMRHENEDMQITCDEFVAVIERSRKIMRAAGGSGVLPQPVIDQLYIHSARVEGASEVIGLEQQQTNVFQKLKTAENEGRALTNADFDSNEFFPSVMYNTAENGWAYPLATYTPNDGFAIVVESHKTRGLVGAPF